MRADISMLALAAATALTLALPSAGLAGPEPAELRLEAPNLVFRHHPRAALPPQRALEAATFELEGILERGDDETLVLALPIREATRRRIAMAQGRPLSDIPRAVRRRMQIAPGALGEARADLNVGKPVRAVLTRDRSGATFVVDLLSPRR